MTPVSNYYDLYSFGWEYPDCIIRALDNVLQITDIFRLFPGR